MLKEDKFIFYILITTFLFLLYNSFTTECFTPVEEDIADKLVHFFKTTQSPSFINYLDKLIDIDNRNENLISKGVFNKLNNIKDITRQDVLQYFSL